MQQKFKDRGAEDDARGKGTPPSIKGFNTIEDIHTKAMAVAVEAIQTAAMILKYDLSPSDKTENGGNDYE